MSAAALNYNKSVFTFENPRRQYFAFPPDVIAHLWKNPKSGNGLEKLYQTCKYFFSRQKLLVINCYTNLSSNSFFAGKDSTMPFKLTCTIKMDNFANLRFWPSNSLMIWDRSPQTFKNFYRCSVSKLTIHYIVLTLKEFEFLVAEVKEFHFSHSTITNDGSVLSLDIILEKLPNVKKLSYINYDEKWSSELLQRMTQKSLCKKLEFCNFSIRDIYKSSDQPYRQTAGGHFVYKSIFVPSLFFEWFGQNPSCCFTFSVFGFSKQQQIQAKIESALKCFYKNDETKPKLNVEVSY